MKREDPLNLWAMLAGICLSYACAQAKTSGATLGLVPVPARMKVQKGEFQLSRGTPSASRVRALGPWPGTWPIYWARPRGMI